MWCCVSVELCASGVVGGAGVAAATLSSDVAGRASERSAPQKRHVVCTIPPIDETFLPHAGQMTDKSTDEGLKHMVIPFRFCVSAVCQNC